VQRAAGATPVERALIGALARRHSADPAVKREALDRAYADAMREVAGRFPDDLEASTFFADAAMNLRPWNLWTLERAPQPGTEEILMTLERVMARNPDHPGALHLYIHAVEAGPDPRRGEAAADRLLRLMPGAGHLVHMPSHIYWRVGRYADAVAVNEDAMAADRRYFKTANPSPIYRGLYYPHTIDFIWQSASMQGRSAQALRAARDFAESAPSAMIKEMPDMETAPVAPIVSLVRFGRWDEVLRQPAPPAEWLYTRAVWHYARGMAFNAKGQPGEARGELTQLEAALKAVPPERTIAFFFRAGNLIQLAANVLAGEIAAKAGDYATAERLLRAAVAEQDTHWFTEPPPWYFPVRQALGAVLLQAGRAGDAEQVYREDLARNPDNGWSLLGLTQALRAQGKAGEAAMAENRFRKAWASADVTLSASRF
jgi:tetratricopeptide (TPR) repeat protein